MGHSRPGHPAGRPGPGRLLTCRMSAQTSNKKLQRQEEVNLKAWQHLQPGLPALQSEIITRQLKFVHLVRIQSLGRRLYCFSLVLSGCSCTATHPHMKCSSPVAAPHPGVLAAPRLQEGAPPAPRPLLLGRAPAAAANLQAPTWLSVATDPLLPPSATSRGRFETLGGAVAALHWDSVAAPSKPPCFKGGATTGKPATR